MMAGSKLDSKGSAQFDGLKMLSGGRKSPCTSPDSVWSRYAARKRSATMQKRQKRWLCQDPRRRSKPSRAVAIQDAPYYFGVISATSGQGRELGLLAAKRHLQKLRLSKLDIFRDYSAPTAARSTGLTCCRAEPCGGAHRRQLHHQHARPPPGPPL